MAFCRFFIYDTGASSHRPPKTYSRTMDNSWIDIRRTLHAHPEVGFCEEWTSQYIADFLRSRQIETHIGIAKTGVVARIPERDNALPAIGYRADMDALPVKEETGLPFASHNGCMHACGHDVHITVALALADYFSKHPLNHPLVLVFQPNEEGAPGELPSGAQAMCDAGILEQFGITSMFALHCDPELEVGTMGVCAKTLWAASGRFSVCVEGKAGHAAYPQRSHDALLAAARLVESIYLQRARERADAHEVLSVCKFNAGDAFNVIAGQATFEGIVRASTREELDGMFELIRRCSAASDFASHTKTTVGTYYGALPVINDDRLLAIARETWGKKARTISMTMASEDFSHFSKRVPSFYAMLGIAPEGKKMPPLHASNFIVDERAIHEGIQAMTALLEAADRAPVL